jgi:uncharacterized protein involved in type VI secretion and phage assembly
MNPLFVFGPMFDMASMLAQQVLRNEVESDRVYEAVIGKVADNKDPLKLGRVKLIYPVLSEDNTSDWSPIIMLGASKNRGWFFIPEIHDEVLLLFEHGNVHRPIVLGALWNGPDKPPDRNDGGNPRRVIKSRAGSRIIFDDGQKLIIEDGTGKGRITLDAGANKITIEALEGDVCFQSPSGDMKVVAGSAELTAGSNVEIHAGAAMAWGSGGGTKISGSGGVTMSGARVNINCGTAQSPEAPTASPEDVADPYGS